MPAKVYTKHVFVQDVEHRTRRHAVIGWRLIARNKLKCPANYFLFIASREYPHSFEIYGFAVINPVARG